MIVEDGPLSARWTSATGSFQGRVRPQASQSVNFTPFNTNLEEELARLLTRETPFYAGTSIKELPGGAHLAPALHSGERQRADSHRLHPVFSQRTGCGLPAAALTGPPCRSASVQSLPGCRMAPPAAADEAGHRKKRSVANALV